PRSYPPTARSTRVSGLPPPARLRPPARVRPRRLDLPRRRLPSRRRRLLPLPGPHRRPHHLRRLQHRRARGRERAAEAPRRGRVRRHRRARRAPRAGRQGVRRPPRRPRPRRRPRAGVAGLREGRDRAVQVPPRDPVHGRAAADADGEAPALPPPRDGRGGVGYLPPRHPPFTPMTRRLLPLALMPLALAAPASAQEEEDPYLWLEEDRKSTRLNSSHVKISY